MSKIIALISGGNTGIGYETVKKLATENPQTHHIWMGTRSIERGQSALKSMDSPPNVTPIQLDITQDQSIDSAFKTIQSTHGKLDILINNAGTAGKDIGADMTTGALPEGKSLREVWDHCYKINITSTAILTDKMIPLLEKSSAPKIIFISSALGSIGTLAEGKMHLVPLPWYSSSKAALNHMSVYYAKKYPAWKVNACCPGYNATGLNGIPKTVETDPKNGAVNVCRLAMEGGKGVSGTFSNRFSSLPW